MLLLMDATQQDVHAADVRLTNSSGAHPDVAGQALQDKERTYPELVSSGRCCPARDGSKGTVVSHRSTD